uniref:Uncharacterized protein n=1 Tax=Skeletonema marinoi TaxID=267567 RepID=A0A7S1GFJ9_9STRA|mmetsp:Transcript_20938/g.31950  ORF Transcript_20938/g.31950 Transcript_20938/m.31950 type:complete len:258 (+) Transcript_20938:113-886(+)
MGSTVSFLNDTDDVIMVKLTANTRIIAPIVTGVVALVGGAVTVMTGGMAGGLSVAGTTITYTAIGAAASTASAAIANSITSSVLATFEKKMIKGYEREGFAAVRPGQKWTGPRQTLSLNQRMWLVRLDGNSGSKTMKIRTADSSVWTGSTDDSTRTYVASDPYYFPFQLKDEYNVNIRGGALTQRGGAIDQTKKGNSLMNGLATGLLLASPYKSAEFRGMGMNNKRCLSSQGPFSRPLALGTRPRSDFEAKISDLLK